MKSKPSKTAREPQCRKCGATDIEFTYRELDHDHEIDEKSAIETACYIIGNAIKDEADQGCDAEQLSVMSATLFHLAVMLKVRKGERGAGDAEEATPEMPS